MNVMIEDTNCIMIRCLHHLDIMDQLVIAPSWIKQAMFSEGIEHRLLFNEKGM